MKKFIFSVVFLTVIRWKFINHHRIKITLPHLFRVSCFTERVVRRNNDVLLVGITKVILSEKDSNDRVNLSIDHPIFPHFFENCPRFFYNGGVAAFSAFANLPLIKCLSLNTKCITHPGNSRLDVIFHAMIEVPNDLFNAINESPNATLNINGTEGFTAQELELIDLYRNFPLRKQMELLNYAFNLKEGKQ